MAKFRYTPLYLNDRLWKYVMADVDAMHLKVAVNCIPTRVTQEAREAEPSKNRLNHFAEEVMFVRRSIPLRPRLNDERWYGVHSCLQVDDKNLRGQLIYDVPDDPEDPYYGKHRST